MTSPAVIASASMENQCLAFPRQPRVENQRRDARWNVRAEKTKENNVTLDRASQPNDTFSSPSLCLGPNPTQKSSFGYACAELRQLVPAVRRRRPHGLPTCLMRMLRPLIGGKCPHHAKDELNGLEPRRSSSLAALPLFNPWHPCPRSGTGCYRTGEPSFVNMCLSFILTHDVVSRLQSTTPPLSVCPEARSMTRLSHRRRPDGRMGSASTLLPSGCCGSY